MLIAQNEMLSVSQLDHQYIIPFNEIGVSSHILHNTPTCKTSRNS